MTSTQDSLRCTRVCVYVQDGEFVWSKQTQGFVLGAFFWGYLITQIPGGLLAQKFGGKRVLGYCLVVASIATLLCSVGARVSPYLLIFLRIIIGLGQVRIRHFTPTHGTETHDITAGYILFLLVTPQRSFNCFAEV